MHLVAVKTFELLAAISSERVRVVRVDLLAIDGVVFGAFDDLVVAGVLIGHMAAKAEFIGKLGRLSGCSTGLDLRVFLLQIFSLMAIHAVQPLLGMGIGQ